MVRIRLFSFSLISLVCALIFSLTIAIPAYAASLKVSSTTPTPTPTSNPTVQKQHCRPNNRNCPKVGPNIQPGNTGQYSAAKPAIIYCNGRLYVGWTGTDQHLNIGWGSTGNAFTNVVTFNEIGAEAIALIDQTNGYYTGPALACYKNQVSTAWTSNDSDHKMYIGFFDGNPNDNFVQNQTPVRNQYGIIQTSNATPALTVDGSYLRIGWAGKGNGYPNIMRSSDGLTFTNQNYWSSQVSTRGIGLARYCPAGTGACNPWVSWIGTDSQNSLNNGYFDLSSGQWNKIPTPSNYVTTQPDSTGVLQ